MRTNSHFLALPLVRRGRFCHDWMDREIKARIHLGAYLLQRLHNLTELEFAANDSTSAGENEKGHIKQFTKEGAMNEIRRQLEEEIRRMRSEHVVGTFAPTPSYNFHERVKVLTYISP